MNEERATTELLILGDGKILVHNLTPAMAELLAELDPDNLDMRQRAAAEVLVPKLHLGTLLLLAKFYFALIIIPHKS